MPLPSSGTEQAIRRVVEEVTAGVAPCSSAAVTLVHGDKPVLVVGSSLLGHRLEQAQWDSGHGPGLDAIRQFQVFNVASLAATTSWPAFARLALSHGVRSTLAVPITLRDRVLGVLNLYSSEDEAFAGNEQVGLHHASRAALALSAPSLSPRSAPARPPRRPGRAEAV